MRLSKLLILFALTTSSFILFGPVSALEKVSIAVIDFEGNAVSDNLTLAMSEVSRTVLVNSGRFTVTERARIDDIMKELAFQQTGATGTDQAVRLGKMLNVQKLIFGSISLAGNTYLLNVSLVDVQKAEVEASELHKYVGLEDFLSEEVMAVITKLIERIPLTGNVIKVDPFGLMADVGRKQGIQPGFLMKITRKVDTLVDLEGKIIGVIEEDIAEARVEKVGDNWCQLTLTENEYTVIKKGDFVRLPLTTQKEKTDDKKKDKKKEEKKKEKKEEEEKKKDEPLVPVIF